MPPTNNKAILRMAACQEMGILFHSPDSRNLTVASSLSPLAAATMARHVFSAHTPLWAFEDPWFATPVSGGPDIFAVLPPSTGLEEALTKTHFVVLVGAVHTPELQRLLLEQKIIVLLFEHDAARLEQFFERVTPAQLANKAFVLCGRPSEFLPPLSALLPPTCFNFGFPVFFVLDPAEDALHALAQEVIERIEVLFFRHRIYPLSGQSLNRGLPLRQIAMDMFYDQQIHAYQNLASFVKSPDIGTLRGLFEGETAVLIAAGSDLLEKVPYLREQKTKGVLIAVNSAMKPLLAAGVLPHFCIANDTSMQMAGTFHGLPPLRQVILVAHCLSAINRDIFPHVFLFGNCWPEVFGTRPNLRLHGSVITTAFSLARHLGCRQVVLVGAQLSSDDPWSLRYANGASGVGPISEEEKHSRVPFLVPVQTKYGEMRYTSLNFLDVKHWLLDELRTSDVRCINTTKQSILDGSGVILDEAPSIAPTGKLMQCLRQAFAAAVPASRHGLPRLHAALGLVEQEKAWLSLRLALTEKILAMPGLADYADVLAAGGREAGPRTNDFLNACRATLQMFDGNNISYLVQRFEDFHQPTFHASITSPNIFDQYHGFVYYYTKVKGMLRSLLDALSASETVLRDAQQIGNPQ